MIITPPAELEKLYEEGRGSVEVARHLFGGAGRNRHHRAAVSGVAGESARTDRGADAGEEAADAGRPARRIRSRESDAPRAGAALEPHRRRTADEPPVRDHRSRTQLPREHQRDRPRHAAARERSRRTAARVAGVPAGNRHAPAGTSPREDRAAAAHSGRPADRVSQHRRSRTHRSRGRQPAKPN